MKSVIWQMQLSNIVDCRPSIPFTQDCRFKDQIFLAECLEELSDKSIEDLLILLNKVALITSMERSRRRFAKTRNSND